MNSFAEDVKDMLEAQSSLGLTYGTNLFLEYEPDGPKILNDIVTIFTTPSFPPDLNLDPSESYFYSSVQIRVRDKKRVDGMALARNIMDYLHGLAQEEWNGTLYTVIQAMGEPAPLDWDTNDRIRIITNYNCQRR